MLCVRRRLLSTAATSAAVTKPTRVKPVKPITLAQLGGVLPPPVTISMARDTLIKTKLNHLSKTAQKDAISAKYMLKKYGSYSVLEGTDEELLAEQVVKWLHSVAPLRFRLGYKQIIQQLKQQLITIPIEDLTPREAWHAIKGLAVVGGDTSKIPGVYDWSEAIIEEHFHNMTLNEQCDILLYLADRRPDNKDLFSKVRGNLDDKFAYLSKSGIAKMCVALSSVDQLDDVFVSKLADDMLSVKLDQMFMFETWQLMDILWAFARSGRVHKPLFDAIGFEFQLPTRAVHLAGFLHTARLFLHLEHYQDKFFHAGFRFISTYPYKTQAKHVVDMFNIFMKLSPPLLQSHIEPIDFQLVVRRVRSVLIQAQYNHNAGLLDMLRECSTKGFYDVRLFRLIGAVLEFEKLTPGEFDEAVRLLLLCPGIDMDNLHPGFQPLPEMPESDSSTTSSDDTNAMMSYLDENSKPSAFDAYGKGYKPRKVSSTLYNDPANPTATDLSSLLSGLGDDGKEFTSFGSSKNFTPGKKSRTDPFKQNSSTGAGLFNIPMDSEVPQSIFDQLKSLGDDTPLKGIRGDDIVDEPYEDVADDDESK